MSLTIKGYTQRIAQFGMALSIVCCSQVATAKHWQLKPQSADVEFTLKLLGGLEPTGKFQQFSGSVFYDSKQRNQSHMNLKIATKSLKIDLPDAFNSLAKSDFFQTKKHPYMTFRSKRVRFTKKDTAKIIGHLTFMGKTRPIIITANIQPLVATQGANKGQVSRLKFKGSTVIKRSDYDFRVPVIGLSDNIVVHLKGVLVAK